MSERQSREDSCPALICPTAQMIYLRAPSNNPLRADPKSDLKLQPSRPPRGAFRDRHKARDGMRWTRQRRARRRRRRAGSHGLRERRDGTQTNDAKPPCARLRRMGTRPVEGFGVGRAAYGQVVWSWHPLLVSSPRRICRPDRASKTTNPRATVAKGIRAPGRSRSTP